MSNFSSINANLEKLQVKLVELSNAYSKTRTLKKKKERLNQIQSFFYSFKSSDKSKSATEPYESTSYFNLLNKGIIVGEVFNGDLIKSFDNIEINLNSLNIHGLLIKDSLNKDRYNEFSSDIETSFKISEILNLIDVFEDFIDSFFKSVQIVQNLRNSFDNRGNNFNDKRIVRAVSINDIEERFINQKNPLVYQELLISINAYLCEIDRNFYGSSRVFKELIALLKYFENNKNELADNEKNLFFEFLKSKTYFLIYKCIYRKYKVLKKDNYRILIKDKEISFDDIKKESAVFFEDYIKIIELLYVGCRSDDFNNKIKDIDGKLLRNEKINVSDFHFLIKYYRFKNNIPRLKEIKSKISDYFKDNLIFTTFNKIAETRLINYCNNSIFRVYSEMNNDDVLKLDYFELKTLFESFASFQKNNNKSDYKLYEFWLKFILIKVKALITDKEIKQDVVLNIVSDINKYIEEYSDEISNSKELGYLHVYSNVEECLKEVKLKNESQVDPINYYLDSSYVLPSDIKKEQSTFNELLRNINITMLEADIKISAKLPEEAKKDVEKIIKNKQEEENLKQVQVLGVFAAIIAFVVTSVGGLPEINHPFLVIYFMIGFAFSMVIFVGAIKLLVTPHEFINDTRTKMVKSAFIVFLLMIALYALYTCVLSNMCDSNQFFKKQDKNSITNNTVNNCCSGQDKENGNNLKRANLLFEFNKQSHNKFEYIKSESTIKKDSINSQSLIDTIKIYDTVKIN